MRNVIIRKNALLVVTDKEAAGWANAEINNGAVVITVPSSLSAAERLAYVKEVLSVLRNES